MTRSKSRWFCAFAALSGLVAPAHVRAGEQPPKSVWDVIREYSSDFEQLVLISGYTNLLSQCEPGSAQFTAFVPLDEFVVAYFREKKISIADIAGTPAAAEQFVADHIVNGHMIPVDLVSPNFIYLQTWSGRNLVRERVPNTGPAEVGVNVLINGQFIIYYHYACNGVVYFLFGNTYGPPSANVAGRTTVELANIAGAPRGPVRPERPSFYEMGPDASELPETR